MTGSNNTNYSNVQVPIFEGENYDFWCIKMQTLFRSLDAWEVVESGYEEPESTANLSQAQRKELKEKRSTDAGALSMIQRGVSNAIFPRIMRAKTSKEAWEILQQEFQGDDKVRAVKLQTFRREFANIKMKENETLQEFSSRFMGIVNQMRSYGEEMSEKSIIDKILISLPRKFDPIVAVIENTKNTSTMSTQEVMGSLKSFEQRLEQHSETQVESAFQAKLSVDSKNFEKKQATQSQNRWESTRGGRQVRGRGRNGRGRGRGSSDRRPNDETSSQRCGICKKDNHVEKDCWFKGKPQCYNCKKFGHVQKDCRWKSGQQASFTEEKEAEASLFYACQAALEEKNDHWYIDSACSNHMTSDKKMFHELDSNFQSKIKIGNGDYMEMKGIGSVGVQTKKGPEMIHEVMLVPEAAQNLLSVGQLVEHGYALYFADNCCIIYDKNDRRHVLAQVKMENRCFPLNLKSIRDVALKMII